jgi:hypothetical protein
VSRYFDNYWKEFKPMSSRARKSTKTESLLMSLAESIGSTLGTLAAKADAAQKVLVNSEVGTTLGRKGKRLVRKTKEVAGVAKGKVARSKAAANRTKKRAPRKAKSARGTVQRAAKRTKRAVKRVSNARVGK